MQPERSIMFLCSGNYFRSRFAEELFNHWAPKVGLKWTAYSCGLIEDLDQLRNIGPISPHTQEALTVRGIKAKERWPMSAERKHFEHVDLTIAVKEKEHRPMMQERFPDLENKIRYWQVDDIDVAPPSVGINQIERNVVQLVQQLRQAQMRAR